MSILTMHHGLMAGIKQGDPPGYVTIGGRLYRTVTIGTQTWMAENLDYKFNGCVIGEGDSDTQPRANYYNNDEQTYGVNGNKYGLLYNKAAMSALEANKSTLCPGWHVPLISEWRALYSYVGTDSGTKLKTVSGWYSGGNGTDDYGFSIQPCGMRGSHGSFSEITRAGYFGASDSGYVWNEAWFGYNYAEGQTATNSPDRQFYIRLVKDA